MLPGTLPFNLALAVVSGLAWRLGRGRPRPVLLVAGAAAMVLALVLGDGTFGVLRLLAWACFGHAPLLAGALAWRARRESRRVAAALGIVALALPAIAWDAFLVEPRRLEVSTHRIVAPGLPARLRIALVADLQTDRIGEHERRALAAVAATRPDLVLLAGDYVQLHSGARRAVEQRALRDAWAASGISPPLGTIAVQGNVDPAGWEAAFSGLPVTTVTDGPLRLRRGALTITALPLRHSFDRTLVVDGVEGYHVVLGHAPDYALGRIDAQLLLAGHVHGGQVRLPGIGPLITFSAVPRAWAVGRSEIPGGRTLLVSRGIGMERGLAPRLRFLCPPELVLVDLVPADPR